MISAIIGSIAGLGLALYCMVRSWQCFMKSGHTRESKVVSLVVSILFALVGTCLAICAHRELMEILNGS